MNNTINTGGKLFYHWCNSEKCIRELSFSLYLEDINSQRITVYVTIWLLLRTAYLSLPLQLRSLPAPVDVVDRQTANSGSRRCRYACLLKYLTNSYCCDRQLFLPTVILSFHYQHRIAPWALNFLFLTDTSSLNYFHLCFIYYHSTMIPKWVRTINQGWDFFHYSFGQEL